MSHIITWFFIACAAIVAHACGAPQDTVSEILIISAAALCTHRLLLWVTSLGEVTEQHIPFPDLHAEFVETYFRADRTSRTDAESPHLWYLAAKAAKRWELAITKPRRHTVPRLHRKPV